MFLLYCSASFCVLITMIHRVDYYITLKEKIKLFLDVITFVYSRSKFPK